MTSADSESPAEPDVSSRAVTRRIESAADAASKLTSVDADSRTLMGAPAEAGAMAEADLVGGKIGKYEIRAQLGVGGMGAVYLAFDPLIEREVAIKMLTPDMSGSPTALQRFLGEARAIGRLNHPHVVSIYDIDQWNGQYFIVMELLAGGSVAGRVDEAGRLPWEEACRLIAQAARGLGAAHEAGMIHRDVKPENLMLTRDLAVKVVDFGLSKLIDAAHDPRNAVTKTGQILGTPQYMSPEQFESAETDARTDVYSLGATLFRLLTGRFPFHDCRTIVQVMTAHLTKPPPAASELFPDIPPECDRIIARAMAKSPADRYAAAALLAADLEALLPGAAPAATTAMPASVDRPLQTVVIVEPSKLQAAVLGNACTQVGARTVQTAVDAASARAAVAAETPDLFITSLQLPDGQGLDLLQEFCRQGRFKNSTVVLNSSDCTLDQLTSAGPAGGLVLAPKKARPEAVLRAVHAAGPVTASTGPLAAPLDPAALRVQIVLETGRIPDRLAELIRELQLLDVEVASAADFTPSDPLPQLVLWLRRTPSPDSTAADAEPVQRLQDLGPLIAAVQIDASELTLRAVGRQGVVALCRRPLDAARLTALLQASRS